MNRQVYQVSNNEFMKMIFQLANYIKKYPRNFDTIYGVPQNGTIIASLLAKILKIRFVNNVVTTRTLIIDDISDTGKTLNTYKNNFPDNIIATLYYRTGTDVVPDIVVSDAKDKWIQFTWEQSSEQLKL